MKSTHRVKTLPRLTERLVVVHKPRHLFQHIGACGNPSVFQEFVMCTERVCLLSWSFCWSLFFLHRHDDVTPSWFRALES